MSQQENLSNERLLELFVARLNEFAVLLLDRDGNFRSWNPAVERQLGYTADEFIGQNGEILMPLSDRLRRAFHRELQVATEKGRASDTKWLVTKSGRPIYVEGLTLSLRDPNTNELLGFGKILHDVTKRKQTEDDLKTLTQALDQSVVYIISWDGIVEHWTTGCERLYGYASDEVTDKRADDLLHTVYPLSWAALQKELLDAGSWRGELQQRRRDGTAISISAHWMRLEDGAGGSSIIAAHSDITSLFQMQQELEAANKRLKSMASELERSNAELEEFARIASHDLSAPITSTRWLVDLLSMRHGEKLNAEGKNYLQQIATGLQRMTDLVEAILTHATAGTNPIAASEPTSANEALNIAVENLRKDFTISGAILKRGPLPELLIGQHFLAQLFQNLLSNAIKYRRSGVAPEITVEAKYVNSAWTISVQDNGIGIEPAWLERIFLPMQRLHGADIAGSGIGLATCRKIVSRAGGTIWVESERGVGSTFFFTLPGVAEEPAAKGPEGPSRR